MHVWIGIRIIMAGVIWLGTVVQIKGAEDSPVAPKKNEWRMIVVDFCRTKLEHSAWGFAHAERNFLLAQRLAKEEGLEVDLEVIFAAAFLHDTGAFPEFGKVDVDHTESGALTAGEILARTDFPKEKIEAVQETIRGHMFYSKVASTPEAVVLHDADTLDFLGAVGIARIFSITTRHRWAEDLRGAVVTIDKFRKELPEKLITGAAKKIGEERVKEMKAFLDALDEETHGGKSL